MGKKVLISGAGVAGATAAYWLARAGFEVTVVERATGARSSGSPVDVKGPAVDVVEKMGVMARLREVASPADRMTFIDARGRRLAGIPLRAFAGEAGTREIEVARADLATILVDAGRDSVEYRWGDTITDLVHDDAGVDVTFAAAPPSRFDAVIGADGLHSTVRHLTFGPEGSFIRHTGMYVATMPIDEPMGDGTEVLIYNTPGRAVAVHPNRGRAIAVFMFRRPEVPGYDHRDLDQHKRVVVEAFPDTGWLLPNLLDRLRETDDLYFDSISRMRLPRWSDGRVGLVGDAAAAVSLFGDGSTLAIAGGHRLAEELGGSPSQVAAALRRYETRHRPLVRSKQQAFRVARALLLPATGPGIALRNAVARVTPVLAGLTREGGRRARGSAAGTGRAANRVR
ncbi:FAD-dependent oxidoreductase [Nocardia sp. NBC_01377]|uniref:FAD-dependent oxidoreductase n=1 Tax=Nocardia sp. NBC_01377 TaxID=2903595 RepID=UPI00324FBA9F